MGCSRGKAQQQVLSENEDSVGAGELQPLRLEPDVTTQGASLARRVHCITCPSWWWSQHTWSIVKAASAVAPVWFMAQLCFNTALHLTSVTSNTILSSPSSLFTYFLSVLVLHEKFTYSKLGAVLLTVVGALPCAPSLRMILGCSVTVSPTGLVVRTSALLSASWPAL